MVIGYQYGGVKAFGTPNIDKNYLDGVSLTYGSSPRKHVWSFAAALSEGQTTKSSTCKCSNAARPSSGAAPPDFVGEDYFCDSAVEVPYSASKHRRFHHDDPLWDGAGCGVNSTCCSHSNPPWFFKRLSKRTTEKLELRLCRVASTEYRDVHLSKVALYVW